MINYNAYDLECIDNYFGLLNQLRIELPSDEEIWAEARQYKEIPDFENIYIANVFERLACALEKTFPNKEMIFQPWVNCRDSKFYLNGNEIYTYEDVIKTLFGEEE